MKHLERVKKIVKWAYDMRFVDRNPFSSFKIRKKRYNSNILTWEQLSVLESREFQRPIYNLVKDLFLFSCYTGMPPVDLQRLRPHQLYEGKNDVKWLSYT
ncbi:MAG TPA: site-specific integrase, partial [Methylomirabilota bacterium]|nr:site-specific integrase [Methylomirabilota bacterium]